MKIFSPVLAACVMCVATIGMVGCNGPHEGGSSAAAVHLSAEHSTINVGESTEVTATTLNLAGTSTLKWSASPSNAKITADSNNSQAAMFSADQPGTYVVSATTKQANGNWVTGQTDITVNGQASK